jgi:hypothetical protein
VKPHLLQSVLCNVTSDVAVFHGCSAAVFSRESQRKLRPAERSSYVQMADFEQ